jgi:hypothetical protein
MLLQDSEKNKVQFSYLQHQNLSDLFLKMYSNTEKMSFSSVLKTRLLCGHLMAEIFVIHLGENNKCKSQWQDIK